MWDDGGRAQHDAVGVARDRRARQRREGRAGAVEGRAPNRPPDAPRGEAAGQIQRGAGRAGDHQAAAFDARGDPDGRIGVGACQRLGDLAQRIDDDGAAAEIDTAPTVTE